MTAGADPAPADLGAADLGAADPLDAGAAGRLSEPVELLPEDAEPADRPSALVLLARSRALLRALLTPHRGPAVLSLLIVVLSEAAYLVGPLLVAYGIDTAVPALRRGEPGPLVLAVGGYLLAGLVNAAAKALFTRLSARVAQAVLLDLRGRIFTHAQSLSVSFHERYTSGRVIARMTSDLDSLNELAEEGLSGLLSGGLAVVGAVIALLFLDLPLGLITLGSFIPVAIAFRWFERTSRSAFRRTRTAIAALIVQFTETMNGIRAVVSFRREQQGEAVLGRYNADYARANEDALITLGRFIGAVRLIGNLALAAVMILGAVRVVHGAMAVGVLAAFLLYVRRMYDPLDELAMFYNSFQSAGAALEKISGLLDEEPSVPAPAHPVPLPAAQGRVRFTGVEFSYRPDTPVLHRLDLDVPAGQTVALVGATGAGKSTLAKLLARFHDPTSGTVTLDGVPVADLSDPDLRRAVVMVTQEAFLFSGSVADNIALGRPGAGRAEIEQAADRIGAGEFIRRLPDGFDTDVRKRGGRLSAGQRQLVGFARADLADPAVLILDEATASLDIPSERAVQRALRSVLHGRTAVIIAHRLSTVAIADRVLVMEEGRLVEDGPPAELLAGSGRFAHLHRAWRDSLV